MATAAGLSAHQTKEALRVARVAADEFEAAVERDDPATVTELAERGKVSKPRPLMDLHGRDPDDFRRSTEAQGWLEKLAELCPKILPSIVVAGALDHERPEILKHARLVSDWLFVLINRLEKEKAK